MNLGLSNKHILLTGASGGIGRVTAGLLLEEGARVTGTYRVAKEKLTDLCDRWPETLATIEMDQTQERSVEDAFQQANDLFGRVDVLVANAGIANHEGVAVHEMELKQWSRTLNVNLTGAFLCAKSYFRNLKEFPGESASLILVGSTAGLFGEAWYADYSTSKAGMHGLMMSLKNEIVHLARSGRVNLINPGWTLTPMAEGALSDTGMRERILQTIPMRKTALPEDIAGAVVYLASDVLSGHVSGQTITVAGGMEGRVLYAPDEIGD